MAKEQLDNQPFKKLWKKAIDTFRNLVSSSGTATKPFYLRDDNSFDVIVERAYDADADCSTWKVMKVKINGKERAGSLDSLTVGVDMAVRICMFVATEGGLLSCMGRRWTQHTEGELFKPFPWLDLRTSPLVLFVFHSAGIKLSLYVCLLSVF